MLGTIALIILVSVFVLAVLFWFFAERWHVILPSTRRSIRSQPFGINSLHAYVYGRWTNQYINVLINEIYPRLRAPGKKWFSDHYHGKVLTAEQAQAVVNCKKDIPLRDLEQIIPYPTARDLVLNGPPDVAAYECACRHAREEPCSPTQVCMVIGKPFVDFILEHNPHSSRRLTQGEALDLLKAEHERGHVHSAWFKDAMMNRFYAICNCCSCCCGGIEAMTKYSVPIMASSGYVADVKQELCNQCGVCEDACPWGALTLRDSFPDRNWELCMGCGVCVEKCPIEAIDLVRDEKKGLPLDVRLLA